MKSFIKKLLQKILGFQTYLFVFSVFTIGTLRWNKKEADFLYFLKLIPVGGLVLDIGANIGIMTYHLAKKLKQSKILCFEPIPANVRTLKTVQKFFHLNNAVVYDFALGDQQGEAEMMMPVLNQVKMQGLSHVVHPTIHDNGSGDNFKVRVETLDGLQVHKTFGLPVHAIKMDVENFEYFVLKGAEKTIDQYRPLIYTELWDNENRKNCFHFIREKGYVIMVLDQGVLKPFNPEKHRTQNFFFLPEKE
ncbi:MAG: FkbM family methyltransferase [Bacteroidales bacterium]